MYRLMTPVDSATGFFTIKYSVGPAVHLCELHGSLSDNKTAPTNDLKSRAAHLWRRNLAQT